MKSLSLAFVLLISVSTLAQKIQQIPGRMECEFYNSGGEGVAYHDTDSINNGSGKLNPANGTYLNEFRMKEGVDISYTKERGIDNSKYNKLQPEMNQLYVGWTVPGEWIKYDVDVKKNGGYRVSLMYTANGNGKIALDIDGVEALRAEVTSTNDPADTIAWRQWHHWNKTDLGTIKLTKGKHVITLHTVEHGNMNFDFLEFNSK
ncbi:MAG TPA: carbohydrate-binding protein [Cyclobacteriaceae bacterium]|nr:carbohydrate-binding protein [Cyclobacteriaceae bacterium]